MKKIVTRRRDAFFDGLDLSANHSAIVRIGLDGKLCHWISISSVGADLDRARRLIDSRVPGRSVQIPMNTFKHPDPRGREIQRLVWWQEFFRGWYEDSSPKYMAIEDYAFASQGGAHSVAEIGGVMRSELWAYGLATGDVCFRLYDPTSPKTFIAGRGSADKTSVAVAATSNSSFPGEFRFTFEDFQHNAITDLVDAWVLASMARMEYMLRNGLIAARAVPEHALKVFNRVTKHRKVNILGGDWIVPQAAAENKKKARA